MLVSKAFHNNLVVTSDSETEFKIESTSIK